MNPQLFFAYSALIGLSIPATAAVIVGIDTIIGKIKGKNETTPTILTGKLQNSSDKNVDIPTEVLQHLEITNSPFTYTQPSSEKPDTTLSKKLKEQFPTSGINVSTPNHDSSSHTPINSDKEK